MSGIDKWNLKDQDEEEFLLEKVSNLENEVLMLNKRNEYLERELGIWSHTARENQQAVNYWHKEYTEKTRELLKKIEKLKAKAGGVKN